MSEATEAFDDLYRRWRDPLYRVVVLATGDRDLALAAVDSGFAAMRADPRRSSHPAADVLRRAIARTRKARPDAVRGFRLPEAATGADATAAIDGLRSLDLVDRFVVLGRIYLEWDDAALAHATRVPVAEIPDRFDAAGRAMPPGRAIDTGFGDNGSGDNGSGDNGAAGGRLLDPRLADTLVAAGDGIAGPLSRLESVKTDARSKRAVQAAAALALVAALALATAVAVPRLTGGDPPDIVGAGDPTSNGSGGDVGATTDPPAAIELDAIEWVESGLPFRDGELTAVAAGPDGFVAIASDWSDPSGQGLRLLESESGFEWTVVDAPLQARSGYMNDLRYADGRFVGVGNSFDERTGTDTPMLLLTDEAGEWRNVEIVTEDAIEIDDQSIRVTANVASVAIDGDDITAFGTEYAQEDLWPLIVDALPEGVDSNGGWGASAAGIEIYNERGDVVYTATKEELGIPEELLALMTSGVPSIWRSADGGETWQQERIVGTFGRETYIGQMATDGETILAVVQSGTGGALWSWGGAEWHRVDLGEGVSPTSIVLFDDRFFVSGASGTGGGMWSSEDGAAWEQLDGEVFAGMQVDRVSVSEFGLVAIGQARPGVAGFGPAILEEGDLTVTMDATGRYVVTDASGATLLDVFAEDLSLGPENQVSFVDPATDSVILTVDQRAIDQAWEAVLRQAEVGGGREGGQTTPAIAVTRDGVDWVRLDAEALGEGFYPNTVALGSKAILISGFRESGIEGGPSLWVGELGADPAG